MSISATFLVKKVERRMIQRQPKARDLGNGMMAVPAINLLPFEGARVYADRVVEGNPNAGAIAFDGDPLTLWGEAGISEGDTLEVSVEVVKGAPPDERVTLRAAVESERVAKEIAAEEARTAKAEAEALRAEMAALRAATEKTAGAARAAKAPALEK